MDFEEMRRLIKQIEETKFRIERAEAKAAGTSQALTGMPKAHSATETNSDKIIAVAMAKEEMQRLKDELKVHQDRLLPRIGKITDSGTRMVMRARYIDGMSVDSICRLFAYSRENVYRMLRVAEEICKSG